MESGEEPTIIMGDWSRWVKKITINFEAESWFDPDYGSNLTQFTVTFNRPPSKFTRHDDTERAIDAYQEMAYKAVSKFFGKCGDWPPPDDYMVVIRFSGEERNQ